MNLREANDLASREAGWSLRQVLTQASVNLADPILLASELWVERFLNRLATDFNYGLSQSASPLEEAWQILADGLSQALVGEVIAIALPTSEGGQFKIRQTALVASTSSSHEARSLPSLESGNLITQAQLEDLQTQGCQSAWKIGDPLDPIGWLIAVPLLPTIEVQSTEALFVQMRSNLVQRAIFQATPAVQQARSVQRLQQQCQRLSDRNRELAQTNQLKSEFLANTSHEIRTPLTSILGFTYLLREQGYNFDNARHHEYLKIILSSGQHLLALINDILDLSKIEANQLDLQTEAIDVPHLCQTALKLVQEAANNKGLSLQLEIQPQLPTLIADPLRLKQMLFNLLSNALKFTQRGTVGVTVRVADDTLSFAVWDTGQGISPAEQDLLFKPYIQLANALPGEGTGLGLALTQKLAELHGGWVTLESELNQGSRFTIGLPLISADSATQPLEPKVNRDLGAAIVPVSQIRTAADPTKQPFSLSTPAVEKKCLSMATRPYNILLVEDNVYNARLVITYLSKLGYEVTWAKDGNEMWQSLKHPFPALILMDIHLPGVDGLTLTKQLQASDTHRRIPVIVQTAMAMKGDRERCLAAGAIDYLSKPIDWAILVQMVEKYSNPGNGV